METINKRKLENALLCYFFGFKCAQILLIFSLMGIFMFLGLLYFVIVDGERWPFVLALSFIYPIIRLIQTLRLRKKILQGETQTLFLCDPKAVIAQVKGRVVIRVGVLLIGTVNGRKRKFIEYDFSSAGNDLRRRLKEINSKKAYTITVIRGSFVVANFYGAPERRATIKKHKDKPTYPHYLHGKPKKGIYLSECFPLEKIIQLLTTSETLESLWLLNDRKQYINISMVFDKQGENREYYADKQSISLQELVSLLKEHGFVQCDEVQIFEQFDGNSPALLWNVIEP